MKNLWVNRQLLAQMVRREVVGKYRGSLIGTAWSFLHPLLMLAVYVFVFGEVFKMRWQATASTEDFALNLFAGLIVFNLFAECITRSPGLVLANVNYVKKVVFPLDILAPTLVLAAFFHAIISTVILLLFYMYVHGLLYWTVLWLPLIWLPFLILVLGISWLLAALGVYLRDISQGVGVVVTAMLFLSPIFFPLSALPAGVRQWVYYNPLTLVIQETRRVVLQGQSPEWLMWLPYLLCSVLICIFGYVVFGKARQGFADVI
jgi:lipopolysaccharide transport system permease protein